MGILDIFKKKKDDDSHSPTKHDRLNKKVPKNPDGQDKIDDDDSGTRPVKTYCGICGKTITGNSFKRGDMGIHICKECAPRFSNLSTHERVKTCENCGYRFLPGFSKWYYSSSQPKCIVCGHKLSEKWTYERLMKMLSNPDLSSQAASDVMTVIKYGRLGIEKCPKLELSKIQKQQLYLKAIKLPYLISHYEAFLALRRSEPKSDEVKKAIIDYEKKREDKKDHNSQNKIETPPKAPYSKPSKDAGTDGPGQKKSQSKASDIASKTLNKKTSLPSHSLTTRDQLQATLKMLPVDILYSNAYFKKNLTDALDYIQDKISAPSMHTVNLCLSHDKKTFIIGNTDTHLHIIKRCAKDLYAFTTRKL
ncbi:MAG: hypothetical protein ACLFSQ_11520 [Candidatus Zixiibacteriota bacterium]